MNMKGKELNSKMVSLEPEEKRIQETIRKSKQVFYAVEQERMLSYYGFLWEQFKVIQKRWWIIQFLLLCIVGVILINTYEDRDMQRGLGVTASMFVILIIPEFWRNRTYQCMEIEEASYYSLRQIYAARMLLFGIVDICLLTVFCVFVTMDVHIEFTKLLVQFLLPMIVTACICFGTLCSKRVINEAFAICLCFLWCIVWLSVTLTEQIYTMITMPIWFVCIGVSLVFFCITVYRALCNCGKYWEVNVNGIGTE